MKTILILFVAFGMNAQSTMFKVGKYNITDYDLHYAVSVNMSAFISSNAYYVTKRPLISGLIGLGASFLVGMGKEYIYDGMMHKGNKSMLDLDADARGSIVGGLFSFGIMDTMEKRKQKIDSLKYQFQSSVNCDACKFYSDKENACLTVYVKHTCSHNNNINTF